MKITLASVAFLLALQASAFGGIETNIPQAKRAILPSGVWTPTVELTQKALIAIQSFLERPTSGDQRSKGEIRGILSRWQVLRPGICSSKFLYVLCAQEPPTQRPRRTQ